MINVWGTLLYVASNLVAATMLGCMLASAFVHSDVRFRIAAGVLAASCLGCFFYALGELFTRPREILLELGPVQWVQVAQSLALAAVLVMMRLRQRKAGQHVHPRERMRDGLHRLRTAFDEDLERVR